MAEKPKPETEFKAFEMATGLLENFKEVLNRAYEEEAIACLTDPHNPYSQRKYHAIDVRRTVERSMADLKGELHRIAKSPKLEA